jgi:excisionase family DNA binding protein
MPRIVLKSAEVAAALGLDARTVERLADSGELPGRKVGGAWSFRAAEISDWAGRHLGRLPREKGRDKGKKRSALPPVSDLLLPLALQTDTVSIQLAGSTRHSVLRELVPLADRSGQIVDARALLDAVLEREKQQATALPGGIAIPHSSQIGHVRERPVIAAGRAGQGIPFGDPAGGLTDLFFLLCCLDYRQHLLYLGRLARLLAEQALLDQLRAAETDEAFVQAIWKAEEGLCAVG